MTPVPCGHPGRTLRRSRSRSAAQIFVACLVEAVEALTIVLAVGYTRGWRAAWEGVAAGLAVLAVTVAVFGPALAVIPIGRLRLVVGGLLLIFGLQWLRKAILRASGFKALHDEEAAFACGRPRFSSRPSSTGHSGDLSFE